MTAENKDKTQKDTEKEETPKKMVKVTQSNGYTSEIVKEDDILVHGVKDAELIISHASENGLDIEDKDVGIITESKHLIQKGTLTADEEKKFWIAYRNLSKHIFPVNIDSLHAAQRRKVLNRSWLHKLLGIKYKAVINIFVSSQSVFR